MFENEINEFNYIPVVFITEHASDHAWSCYVIQRLSTNLKHIKGQDGVVLGETVNCLCCRPKQFDSWCRHVASDNILHLPEFSIRGDAEGLPQGIRQFLKSTV